MQNKLDLYTHFLLTIVHQATATGLSNVVDGAVSHDSITRLLTENEFTSKDLWQSVNPLVRQHETKDGCLIFDDSIVEKKYMDENALCCWHFDHSTNKAVKGINLLTAFYHSHHSDREFALRVPIPLMDSQVGKD